MFPVARRLSSNTPVNGKQLETPGGVEVTQYKSFISGCRPTEAGCAGLSVQNAYTAIAVASAGKQEALKNHDMAASCSVRRHGFGAVACNVISSKSTASPGANTGYAMGWSALKRSNRRGSNVLP